MSSEGVEGCKPVQEDEPSVTPVAEAMRVAAHALAELPEDEREATVNALRERVKHLCFLAEERVQHNWFGYESIVDSLCGIAATGPHNAFNDLAEQTLSYMLMRGERGILSFIGMYTRLREAGYAVENIDLITKYVNVHVQHDVARACHDPNTRSTDGDNEVAGLQALLNSGFMFETQPIERLLREYDRPKENYWDRQLFSGVSPERIQTLRTSLETYTTQSTTQSVDRESTADTRPEVSADHVASPLHTALEDLEHGRDMETVVYVESVLANLLRDTSLTAEQVGNVLLDSEQEYTLLSTHSSVLSGIERARSAAVLQSLYRIVDSGETDADDWPHRWSSAQLFAIHECLADMEVGGSVEVVFSRLLEQSRADLSPEFLPQLLSLAHIAVMKNKLQETLDTIATTEPSQAADAIEGVLLALLQADFPGITRSDVEAAMLSRSLESSYEHARIDRFGKLPYVPVGFLVAHNVLLTRASKNVLENEVQAVRETIEQLVIEHLKEVTVTWPLLQHKADALEQVLISQRASDRLRISVLLYMERTHMLDSSEDMSQMKRRHDAVELGFVLQEKVGDEYEMRYQDDNQDAYAYNAVVDGKRFRYELDGYNHDTQQALEIKSHYRDVDMALFRGLEKAVTLFQDTDIRSVRIVAYSERTCGLEVVVECDDETETVHVREIKEEGDAGAFEVLEADAAQVIAERIMRYINEPLLVEQYYREGESSEDVETIAITYPQAKLETLYEEDGLDAREVGEADKLADSVPAHVESLLVHAIALQERMREHT